MKSFLIYCLIFSFIFIQYSCDKNDKTSEEKFDFNTKNSILKTSGGEDDDIPIIIRFSGHVVDNQTNPISGVNVSLKENGIIQYETTTNLNGYFNLDSVETSSYNLGFSVINFNSEVFENESINSTGDSYNWGYQVLLPE